jgi:hypothetical protein
MNARYWSLYRGAVKYEGELSFQFSMFDDKIRISDVFDGVCVYAPAINIDTVIAIAVTVMISIRYLYAFEYLIQDPIRIKYTGRYH